MKNFLLCITLCLYGLLCITSTHAKAITPDEVGFLTCSDKDKSYEVVYDLHIKMITIQWRGSGIKIDDISKFDRGHLLTGILDERDSEYCKKCSSDNICLDRCSSRFLINLIIGKKNEIIYINENNKSQNYTHQCK